MSGILKSMVLTSLHRLVINLVGYMHIGYMCSTGTLQSSSTYQIVICGLAVFKVASEDRGLFETIPRSDPLPQN